MFLGKSEEYTGGLIEGFLAAVDAAGFERVNAAAPVGVLLAAKDEDEILAMKLAAKAWVSACFDACPKRTRGPLSNLKISTG